MTLVWARIDQKLIHGQISIAWTPHLSIDYIIVVDHESAKDCWVQKTMVLGLPPEIRSTIFVSPAGLPEALGKANAAGRRVLLLFKNVDGVTASIEAGLKLKNLNLGNLSYPSSSEAVRIHESFYASGADIEAIQNMADNGIEIILQSVPSSKAKKWKKV